MKHGARQPAGHASQVSGWGAGRRSLLSVLLGLVLGMGVGVLGTEVAWGPPNETINCPHTGPCDGTAANDHIHGTAGFDNIDARGGSDIVEGRPDGDNVDGESRTTS